MGSVSVCRYGELADSCRLIEVSACTHADTAGYVEQARSHSAPVQDVARGIQVPIDCEPAAAARMQPIAQFLWNLYTAVGAFLTGVTRIHLDDARTSACCLVEHHRDELCPRSIVDILGEGAPCQAPHVQLFHNDQVVISNEPCASLMQMVCASAS